MLLQEGIIGREFYLRNSCQAWTFIFSLCYVSKRPQYLRNVILYPLYTTAPLVKSPIAYQHTISLSFLLSRDISSPQKLNLLILEHYSDLILSYSSYLKPIALVREEELTLGESTKMEGRQVRAAHLSRLRCNFKPSNQYSSASSGYTYTWREGNSLTN